MTPISLPCPPHSRRRYFCRTPCIPHTYTQVRVSQTSCKCVARAKHTHKYTYACVSLTQTHYMCMPRILLVPVLYTPHACIPCGNTGGVDRAPPLGQTQGSVLGSPSGQRTALSNLPCLLSPGVQSSCCCQVAGV